MEDRLNMKHKLDEFLFEKNHDQECARIHWFERTNGETPEPKCDCGYDEAVDELSALRRRCEDLEMMLRAATTSAGGMMPNLIRRKRSGCFHMTVNEGDGSYHEVVLRDDGTGLPILTEESRAALREATRP